MREVIANILLVSISVAFLGFLGCIWVFGSHYIQEPNLLILISETVVMLLILGFAIWNLVDLVKGGDARE